MLQQQSLVLATMAHASTWQSASISKCVYSRDKNISDASNVANIASRQARNIDAAATRLLDKFRAQHTHSALRLSHPIFLQERSPIDLFVATSHKKRSGSINAIRRINIIDGLKNMFAKKIPPTEEDEYRALEARLNNKRRKLKAALDKAKSKSEDEDARITTLAGLVNGAVDERKKLVIALEEGLILNHVAAVKSFYRHFELIVDGLDILITSSVEYCNNAAIGQRGKDAYIVAANVLKNRGLEIITAASRELIQYEMSEFTSTSGRKLVVDSDMCKSILRAMGLQTSWTAETATLVVGDVPTPEGFIAFGRNESLQLLQDLTFNILGAAKSLTRAQLNIVLNSEVGASARLVLYDTYSLAVDVLWLAAGAALAGFVVKEPEVTTIFSVVGLVGYSGWKWFTRHVKPRRDRRLDVNVEARSWIKGNMSVASTYYYIRAAHQMADYVLVGTSYIDGSSAVERELWLWQLQRARLTTFFIDFIVGAMHDFTIDVSIVETNIRIVDAYGELFRFTSRMSSRLEEAANAAVRRAKRHTQNKEVVTRQSIRNECFAAFDGFLGLLFRECLADAKRIWLLAASQSAPSSPPSP
jgi:hypothetical protein